VTSRGHPYAEFQRALKNGNVWVAEAVARELPRPLSLEDALKLTHLYAEKEQWEKFERAAMKWLRRYLDEKEPTLKSFAKVVQELEARLETSLPD
jgi:predicted metal-dependent HD superfamily phosphohydrolase